MQWIYEPMPALALLIFGIVANLYLGFIGRTQMFASLHVTLSVIALAIAPQSELLLVIAAVVTLFGIALSFRARWDRHLLITIGSFAGFHLYWYFSLGYGSHTVNQKLVGLLCSFCVGAAAALVHYRKEYAAKAFEQFPFLVHLSNWGLLGVGLYLNSLDSPWRGVGLFIGAVAAWFLARHGNTLGIRWLYLTDTLIAQSLAMLSILSFRSFMPDRLTVVALLFVETLLYLRIVSIQGEQFLTKVGVALVHVLALVLVVGGILGTGSSDEAVLHRHAMILLVCLGLGTVYHLASIKRDGESHDSVRLYLSELFVDQPELSGLGALLGFLAVAIAANVYHNIWFEAGALLLLGSLVYLRQRFQSNGLGMGLWMALVVTHVLSWSTVYADPSMSLLSKALHLVPLVALSYLSIHFSYLQAYDTYLRWPGVYLLGLHILVGSYLVFLPISPLIPGVFWLTLSLMALEIANSLGTRSVAHHMRTGEPERFALQLGYLYVLAFLIRHMLVDLQSEAYLGPFQIRLLIEVFAMALFAYWWLYKPVEKLQTNRSWWTLHPLFAELILLFFVIAVVAHVQQLWHPVVWVASALVLARPNPWLPRARWYSLIFSWASAVHVAAISSTYETPSQDWYQQAWFAGSLAIAGQFLYLWFSLRRLEFRTTEFPPLLQFMSRWTERIEPRKDLWICYPVFLCVAIFFYWRFDKAVLTLLWTVEAFGVFVLSILLRESHFRYLALITLAACIARLLFYDLAQSDTLTRALVFLGVGAIMLLMHSVYNNYRDRFA